MFQNGGIIAVFYVRNGMRTAGLSDKQAVALRIVARIVGILSDLDQPAVSLV